MFVIQQEDLEMVINDQPHIVMLLANAFRPDPRLVQASILVEHGYRVTIICWDREAELPAHDLWKEIEIVRVHTVRSAYGSGWRQLFYLPRFWRAAIQISLKLKPNLVHCHDLDTLYAGARIKQRLHCPLVYDAHEHYPALMSLYLPTLFVNALERWERWLLQKVDATITASTVLRDEYLKQGVHPVVTLGNFQDTEPYTAVTDEEVIALRTQLGLVPNTLLVAYIGGFSRNRMLLPLVAAASHLPDMRFGFWGDGLQREELEAAAAKVKNVDYYGWLPVSELPKYFAAADIIYYCLRLDYVGAVYNAPNTLSNAMAAGRPILSNDVGDLGRIVGNTNCGMLIEEATPSSISAALTKLRDPELRAKLGENGRRAAHSEYGAASLQVQLIELYRTMLD